MKAIENIILGKGQVGKVIRHHLIKDSLIYDIGEWEHLKDIQGYTLHICFPYSENFIQIVENAIDVFQPMYLIIHSTVRPGTTDMIDFKFKAYSPIMGRHKDNFKENVLLYTKYIACKASLYEFFKNLMEIPNEHWGDNYKELEYAKSMSTSYQFWNLIYQKIIFNDCKKYGMDYTRVYEKWNRNYNKGIEKEHKEWCRPIYYLDKEPIPKGHCLEPNIYLNDNFINNFLAEWVNKKGKMKLVVLDEAGD